jgi:hypothetical protein
VVAARQFVQQRTAWRIDGTLREFPKFRPIDLWFAYPTHQVDDKGILKNQEAEGDKAPWVRAIEKRRPKIVKQTDRKISVEVAYESCNFDGKVTVKDMAEYMGVTEKTARNRMKEHGEFGISDGLVTRKKT